jgi:DNA (cytosine-5)-methyltransferase 1
MKKQLASLFSGCGGMDLGFEGGFPAHKSWLTKEELKEYKKFNKSGFTKLDELNFETVFVDTRINFFNLLKKVIRYANLY